MSEVVWPEGLQFGDEGHRATYATYMTRLRQTPDVYWQAMVYSLSAAKPELAQRLAAKVDWAQGLVPELWDDGTLSGGEKRFARALVALFRDEPITLYDFFRSPHADVLVRAALWLFERVA